MYLAKVKISQTICFVKTGYIDINAEFYADLISNSLMWASKKCQVKNFTIPAYLIFSNFFHFTIFANFDRKCALKKYFQTFRIQFKFNIEGPYFTDNQSGILQDCCVLKMFLCIRRMTAKNSPDNDSFWKNWVTYVYSSVKNQNHEPVVKNYYTFDI